MRVRLPKLSIATTAATKIRMSHIFSLTTGLLFFMIKRNRSTLFLPRATLLPGP